MNKKLFFLIITKDMQFYKCFEDNLKFLRYRVFVLKSTNSRIKKGFNYLNFFFLSKIYSLNKAKALIIRPDLFHQKFLEVITKKISCSYAYQWDGLSRYPAVVSLIKLFKKFYVFDPSDIKNYNDVYLLNNFYFDCYKDLEQKSDIKYDVYYVGSFDSRIDKVIEVCEILKNAGLELYIKIPCSKKQALKLKQYSYIDCRKISRTYKDNLLNVFQSKIILDFSHDKLHKGLSFRIFEALGYSKKLITTNTLVKKQDFYDSDNILVVDSELKKENLDQFISIEYKKIDKNIRFKYSFSNWLTNGILK